MIKNYFSTAYSFQDIDAKQEIFPVFEQESIAVCFSADDAYIPYLSVTLESIKEHNLSNKNYDISILYDEISEDNKKRLASIADQKFSIRYINIKPFMSEIDKKNFQLNGDQTIATYYRFFIPEIFKNYSKVIYMDDDMLVLSDLRDLYEIDLGEYALGAVIDIAMYENYSAVEKYFTETLKLKKTNEYFNAGLLVFDIPKLPRNSFTTDCFSTLKILGNPFWNDQDVFNKIFNGQYYILENEWNKISLDDDLTTENPPRIVHFAGKLKPWKSRNRAYAKNWWRVAKHAPFYRKNLFNYIKQAIISEVMNVYKLLAV